jgi:hypothetical protein
MRQIRVYITSKREHAEKLRALKMDGIHINARWLWMGERGDMPVTHWLNENFIDAINSDYVILYVERDDDLNTSLIEVGHALSYRKPILIAGERQFTDEELGLPHKACKKWIGFDGVKATGSLEQTLMFIKREVMQREVVTKAGKVAT